MLRWSSSVEGNTLADSRAAHYQNQLKCYYFIFSIFFRFIEIISRGGERFENKINVILWFRENNYKVFFSCFVSVNLWMIRGWIKKKCQRFFEIYHNWKFKTLNWEVSFFVNFEFWNPENSSFFLSHFSQTSPSPVTCHCISRPWAAQSIFQKFIFFLFTFFRHVSQISRSQLINLVSFVLSQRPKHFGSRTNVKRNLNYHQIIAGWSNKANAKLRIETMRRLADQNKAITCETRSQDFVWSFFKPSFVIESFGDRKSFWR